MEPSLKELIDLIKERIKIDENQSQPQQSEKVEILPSGILLDSLSDIKPRLSWIEDFYKEGNKDMVRAHIGHIGNQLVNILKLI